MTRRAWLILAAFLGLLVACGSSSQKTTLRLATTTSVQDAGLLGVLLPAFERKSGIHVEVSAVGSGDAIRRLGDATADVAITHSPDDEARAVAAGEVTRRTPIMHNEFVIVGPRSAVGVVAGAGDAAEALRRIASSGKAFISRADGSGTNLREISLWKRAGIAADSAFIVAAKAGMGATLERASKEEAFTLSDRGTFLAKQKDLDLAIVLSGDPVLRNTYSVLEPRARDGVDASGAHALAEYLTSPEGRALIGAFGVEKVGEPLFLPEGG